MKNNSKKIIDATTLTSNMTVSVTDSKTGAIVTFGNKNMSFEQQHKLLSACMDGKATLDLNGYVYTDDDIYKVINIEWPEKNDDTVDTCDVNDVCDDDTVDTCDVTDVDEIDVIAELDYIYEQKERARVVHELEHKVAMRQVALKHALMCAIMLQ